MRRRRLAEDRPLTRGKANVAGQHELAAGGAYAAFDLRDGDQAACMSVAAKKCASLAGRKRRWSGYGLATGRRRVPVVTQDGLSSEGLTCGAR